MEHDGIRPGPPTLELLERPAWVRLDCDWLRGGLRRVRQVMRAPTSFDRHLRLVEVANDGTYSMRDHPLRGRAERYGAAEGGALMLLLVGERLRVESDGRLGLNSLLDGLAARLEGRKGEAAEMFLAALAELTPSASLHDLAYEILEKGFPLPMDRFLADELPSCGWSLEHVPYETVTQAQAMADDPRERGGPDNLMNHLGRLVGWADGYPSWSFTVEGWEPIRFNGIPEGVVFQETRTLIEIEGYPLPVGAGPAYAEARRRVLAGEGFRIRVDEGGRQFTVVSKIHPRRRALLHPEGFLRVALEG